MRLDQSKLVENCRTPEFIIHITVQRTVLEFALISTLFKQLTTTEGPRLMRISLVQISLLQFFKKLHKYLPYANVGLFISLVRFFGQRIAKKIELMK